MTVYARSDLSAVTVSRDHGGCGGPHSRPVVDGEPARTWALTCPACENVLRADALWAPTVSEIPETPDEQRRREDQERRGMREQADATATALERLSQLGDLPAVLARFMAYVNHSGAAPAGPPSAPQTHTEPAVGGEPAVQALESASDASAAPEEPQGDPQDDGLERMSLPELKALATDLGIRTTRSKDGQIALIRDFRG